MQPSAVQIPLLERHELHSPLLSPAYVQTDTFSLASGPLSLRVCCFRSQSFALGQHIGCIVPPLPIGTSNPQVVVPDAQACGSANKLSGAHSLGAALVDFGNMNVAKKYRAIRYGSIEI